MVKSTLYTLSRYPQGPNFAVSVYGQLLSRYKGVKNRKCSEWQTGFNKSTLHTPSIHHLKSVSNRISLVLGCRPMGPARFSERMTLTPIRAPLKGPARRGPGGVPNDKKKSIRPPTQGGPLWETPKRNLTACSRHPPLCEGTIGSQNKICCRTERMHFCCSSCLAI